MKEDSKMEILFENRYTMKKERWMDWANNPIKKNPFKIIWIILMIFTLFMFLNSILNGDIIFSAFYTLMTVYCIYRAFLRTKLIIIKQFKLIAGNQGALEWERVIQFTDVITVIDGNTTSHYQWIQVVKFIENKNYLILVLKNGLGIRVDKNGFTINNYENFLRYIKNQFPNITLSVKK